MNVSLNNKTKSFESKPPLLWTPDYICQLIKSRSYELSSGKVATTVTKKTIGCKCLTHGQHVVGFE